MSGSNKKLVIVYAGPGSTAPGGEQLDTDRLVAALRARGAEVTETTLGAGADALLDELEHGATTLVLRCDRPG